MTDNSNLVDYRFLGNVHAVVRPLWCHRTIKNVHRFILQNFHMSDKKTHRFHGIFKDDCDWKCLRIGDIKQATFTDERLKAHGANVTMGTTLLDGEEQLLEQECLTYFNILSHIAESHIIHHTMSLQN